MLNADLHAILNIFAESKKAAPQKERQLMQIVSA